MESRSQPGAEGSPLKRKSSPRLGAPSASSPESAPSPSPSSTAPGSLLWNKNPGRTEASKRREEQLKRLVEETDFLSIGKHCSVPDCKQLEYLPCKCGRCGAVTCQQHSNNHNCSNPVENREIPQCPLCQRHLTLRSGADVNSVVERHIASGCKQGLLAKEEKRTRSPKCSAKGCKRRVILPFKCSACNAVLCEQHRFPDDHVCTASRNNSSTSAARARFQSSRPSSSSARSPTACGAAERRRRGAHTSLFSRFLHHQ